LKERWVHVVVVLRAGKFSNGCRIFLNGKEQKLDYGYRRAGSEKFSWATSIPEYSLGRRSSVINLYPFVGGKLADFRAYSRGLNDVEIAALYNSVQHSLGSDGILRRCPAPQPTKKPSPVIWLHQSTSDKNVREFLAHVNRVLSAHCPFHPNPVDFELLAQSADPLETVVALSLSGALFDFALIRSIADTREQFSRVRQLNANILAAAATTPTISEALRNSLAVTLPMAVVGVPPPSCSNMPEAKTPPTL
jgi:hypothetical protein